MADKKSSNLFKITNFWVRVRVIQLRVRVIQLT